MGNKSHKASAKILPNNKANNGGTIRKLYNHIARAWRAITRTSGEARGKNLPNPQAAEDDSISTSDISFNMQDFSSKTADQIMIPRSDIVSVEINSTLDDVCKNILHNGHTRTLVFDGNLDNIVGFLHIKDLFELLVNSKKFHLKKLLRQHIVAPQSIKLPQLLKQMQVSRTHIAVVVDEYGGTDGIITIEDLMEEIVGPIEDELDDEITPDEDYNILKPGVLLANSRVAVSDIEKIINREIQLGEEIETIGGLIMAIAGMVPHKGAKINLSDEIVAEILESTPRKIKHVKITYPASDL